MIKKQHLALFALMAFAVASNTTPNNAEDKKTQTGIEVVAPQANHLDTAEDCAKPTKYPNQDKPMALMMRQMADNAQKMKDKIESGSIVNAADFPFIRFHLVEPTDPDILQPQFFENARMFQEAHKALVTSGKEKQREMYTAYIAQCINCHQTYCSGPLKRIRKLVLN
ncbi:MAG: hypothetical protein EAY81_09725 [Bacteroidetes bacterium]|nr:MAG: hypothetical protein EAY81_09725 [Bacteroidota bacterium]